MKSSTLYMLSSDHNTPGQTTFIALGYLTLFFGLEYSAPLSDVLQGGALWYPAAGLHLALAVLTGYISIPVIFLASTAGLFFSELTLPYQAAFSLIAAIGYGGGGYWLRHHLTRLHPAGPDASEKVLLATFFVPLFVTAGAWVAWSMIGTSPLFGASSTTGILHLWLGSALAIGVLAPTILLLLWVKVQPWVESISIGEYFGWGLKRDDLPRFFLQVVLVILSLIAAFAFSADRALLELTFFPVLWMAYRSRLSRALLGVLIVVVGSVMLSAYWQPITAVIEFQVAGLALCVSAALLGMLTSERQRAFQALRRLGTEDHLQDIERMATSLNESSIDAEVKAILNRLQHMEKDTLQYHVEGLLTLRRLLSTDLETLETRAQQLENLHERKDAFFANLSHEFKTPLTLIIGTLNRTRDGAYGKLTPLMAEQVGVMIRNANRLRRLVDQILDLARLEAGHMSLKVTRHDFVEFVKSITESFEALADQKELDLQFESAVDGAPLYFQREHLEKVLGNLLSNAIKFTPSGGEVKVSLTDEGQYLVLSVLDSGSGISEEKQPYIFDRFYQADSSPTRIAGGTGLGLALVKELVELHRGEVTLTSSKLEGSTFRVRLLKGTGHLNDADIRRRAEDEWDQSAEQETTEAINRANLVEQAESQPTNGAEETDQKTILIVDDNQDLRQFIRHILEPEYRVIEASNGREGLEQASSMLPDLVVADIMMPVMDGFEMNERLKDLRVTDCIPVIFLTARNLIDDQVRGLLEGGDGYVTKPFDGDVLHARIVGTLRQRERLRRRFAKAEEVEEENVQSTFEAKVRAAVQNNLEDGDFTVEMLADAVALSRRQLTRKLKDEVGTTPARFIRETRLERSAELLEEEAGNISEVAYAVGFNSLSYFSRCFREHFDETPSQYVSAG